MSHPAGPEDRTPRRARGEETPAQDTRIHDARQDAARSGDTERSNDTRVIPTTEAAGSRPRSQDAAYDAADRRRER